MTKQEVKIKKQEMFNELFKNCGGFFAFYTQQFDENKTPLKEGEKYVSIGNGGYLPKSKVNEFKIGMAEIAKLKAEKQKPVVYDVEDFQPDDEKVREYEQKQAEKADRFRELAEKAEKQGDQAYKTAHEIGSFIPMGQPILVGHHSEGRHRRDLERIDNNMRKSIELDEKAKYYKEKAANAENSNVISSDDPAAIVKLIEKLQKLEETQNYMKVANKIVKNKKLQDVEKVEKLQEMKISEKNALALLQPDYCGRVGFADYQLTNNNATIRNTKQRIEQLRKQQSQETKEAEINGVKMVDNVEDNRLQLFFDGIPAAETRTELKRNGFRWSPSNGCWQSYRGQYQIDRAKRILTA